MSNPSIAVINLGFWYAKLFIQILRIQNDFFGEISQELNDKSNPVQIRVGEINDVHVVKAIEKLEPDQRINTLAMIAPISNEEKQTVLESVNIKSKTKILSEIIEFYLHENQINNLTLQ